MPSLEGKLGIWLKYKINKHRKEQIQSHLSSLQGHTREGQPLASQSQANLLFHPLHPQTQAHT